MSTPLSAATSTSTPRVNSVPIFSTPSLVNPLRVATSSDLKQLYSSPSMPWCENMSNCVPTCPISLTTSSSLLMRLLLPIGPPVRLVVRSKRRVPNNGISEDSVHPSSNTSPLRIRRAAFATLVGDM